MSDTEREIFVVMVGNNYQKRPSAWAKSKGEAEEYIEDFEWEHTKPEFQIRKLGRAVGRNSEQ